MSENGSAAPSRAIRKIVRSSRASPTGVEATLNSGRGPWTCMRIVLYAARKISLATSGSVVSNTCVMTTPFPQHRPRGAGTRSLDVGVRGSATQRRERGVGVHPEPADPHDFDLHDHWHRLQPTPQMLIVDLHPVDVVTRCCLRAVDCCRRVFVAFSVSVSPGPGPEAGRGLGGT